MPIQGLAFLYVRALAGSRTGRPELEALCNEVGVNVDDLVRESRSNPDLFGGILQGGEPLEPYPITSAVAAYVRKAPVFKQLLAEKMSLGSDWAKNLGNLYTAALPAWMAAGFEDALEQKLSLAGETLLAVGYGSGDAAESLPLTVVAGWEDAAARIGFRDALASPIDLSKEQYEALHDGHDVPNLDFSPRHQFVISRVGETHEPAFQDLGVEYYEYVQ
jgi:hydroxymethylglutaryl-CoA synthase